MLGINIIRNRFISRQHATRITPLSITSMPTLALSFKSTKDAFVIHVHILISVGNISSEKTDTPRVLV
jgi:hypothetical protein